MSSRYMNSLYPGGSKAWNNAMGHFPNIPSFNILKGHIVSLVRPEKTNIFSIHDPIGLRYLFYTTLTILLTICDCTYIVTGQSILPIIE